MLFMLVRISFYLFFFLTYLWNIVSNLWSVSTPASEKDLKYEKKAWNLSYWDFILKTSYLKESIPILSIMEQIIFYFIAEYVDNELPHRSSFPLLNSR